MRKTIFAIIRVKELVLSAILLSISGMASASSLVVNGSFEDPTQSSGSWAVYSAITGWSSTNGIEVRDNVAGTAYEGSNFVELDAYQNSDMWQTISTTAGQVYELTFAYSPRINQPADTNGISAYWNGTLLSDITAVGSNVNNWTLYSFLVTGMGTDVLKFAATGTSNSLGGNVDDVRLSAVPLPAAAWLFGSALAGFMVMSNRRRV